jgi:hypothetical protein
LPSAWIAGMARTANNDVAVLKPGQQGNLVIASPAAANDVTVASQGHTLKISPALSYRARWRWRWELSK